MSTLTACHPCKHASTGNITEVAADVLNPMMRQEAVTASIELHDFILYAGIFIEFCDDFKTALPLAVVCATATRAPSRLLALSSVRKQMMSQPPALSSRFEELLASTVDAEAYEQLYVLQLPFKLDVLDLGLTF